MSPDHEQRPPARQLQMSFDGSNALAGRLRAGRFLILVELAAPSRQQPFDSAVALATTVARGAGNVDEVAALAVTDRLRSEDCHDPVDTAAALAEASGKPCVMHLSGKGSSKARIRELLARGASTGIRTFLAVTGDRSDKHAVRDGTRRVPRYPAGYLDSVVTLKLARAATPAPLLGAAVNPFKYVPEDVHLQFSKMVRKLASGADFIVAQAGWDMAKLQELQWYLQMRDIGNAVLARLQLLSLDDIEGIHEGLVPGVHVSRELAAALQRESNISANQSLAAQLHRLSLQAAGCKLLGFNGVQIVGVRDAQTLDMVLSRIREALDTYTDYAEWVAAWTEHHDALAFAPFPEAYYAFDELLSPERQYYDPEHCRMKRCELGVPGTADRWRARLAPRLLSKRIPDWVATPLRWLVAPGWEGDPRDLRHCYHLNARECPKRLVHGPCGDSLPDGTCEFDHAPCFFHRVIALAHARHEPDVLEAPVP